MASRLSCSSVSLEIQLTKVGEKLLHLPSSTKEIITSLVLTEHNLSTVPQSPSKSLIKPLHQIINALIAKELMRHPNLNVNISVACCICEILRITAPNAPYNNEQIKEFFELVVTSLEKLYSASGGYYGKMTKVIEVFSKARLPVLMLNLQLDGHGLIVRLFQHFLNVSDSISTAIVLDMERIIYMLIEEKEELAHVLQALVITSLKKDNQNASPVCWEFGNKVLMMCAAKLKLNVPDMKRDMCIALYSYPTMVAYMSKTASEYNMMEANDTIPHSTETNKLRKDMSHKIKIMCPGGSIRHCQHASTPSNSATEMNGKRKRNNEKAPSAEHDDILVGRKIRVWWGKDEIYRNGIVKSCDCKYKMHKVLLDSGFEVVVDLKRKRWTSFEHVSDISDSSLEQAVPKKVSSPQSGIICVQGYKVKNINAPILEAILKKHGDIAAKCVFTDAVRTTLLEAVCEIVGWIETNDVTNIISKIEEIDNQVSAAEASKINVSWLQTHLEAIRKRNEAQKKNQFAEAEKLVGKRIKAHSVEYGENLVGKRIKVWWPDDNRYYEGVVESFDSSIKKHKVSYDGGDEELLKLNGERWELVENVSPTSDSLEQAVPISVSSPDSGMTCVQGYKVKNINAPILESIFKKHGDIAANCAFISSPARESVLEIVCEVVRKIQTNDVTIIISDMEELQSQVSAAEAIKVNVSWLQAHLEAIHKRTEAKKKCSMLMRMTANTSLVTIAAEMDVKEIQSELTTVQERFEKAKRCVEVLNIVKKKLNDNFLVSKAETDSWVEQPVL
ncbi:phospholipase-like protein [Artemisia annua]|uniref:Phospholipase-like protein n=1 Tax=Artemisia annua TaxID=35608 RepID=A0A2U1L0T7_ARTAN|nr:phospholipase-like protein [Artemisia annua]